MFAQSTQLKNWLFNSQEKIDNMRLETNVNYVGKYGSKVPEDQRYKYFLTPPEEKSLVFHYEGILCDFCRKFKPPMTRNVIGTSMHYFKRFYLNNSIMDYHPKQILVTCVYLATKIDEFTVSLSQFVGNVHGDREKAMTIILNNELLLMQKLNYNLHVHNPYKPVEGFLLDIKTRFPETEHIIDIWRPYIDEHIDKLFYTDAILLYPPSQIALAAVDQAANINNYNLENYIKLLYSTPEGQTKYSSFRTAQRNMLALVKSYTPLPKEVVRQLEKKVEACRNQENNPDSEAYKRKMQEMLDEDEYEQSEKYSREAENYKMMEEEVLNSNYSSMDED